MKYIVNTFIVLITIFLLYLLWGFVHISFKEGYISPNGIQEAVSGAGQSKDPSTSPSSTPNLYTPFNGSLYCDASMNNNWMFNTSGVNYDFNDSSILTSHPDGNYSADSDVALCSTYCMNRSGTDFQSGCDGWLLDSTGNCYIMLESEDKNSNSIGMYCNTDSNNSSENAKSYYLGNNFYQGQLSMAIKDQINNGSQIMTTKDIPLNFSGTGAKWIWGTTLYSTSPSTDYNGTVIVNYQYTNPMPISLSFESASKVAIFLNGKAVYVNTEGSSTISKSNISQYYDYTPLQLVQGQNYFCFQVVSSSTNYNGLIATVTTTDGELIIQTGDIGWYEGTSLLFEYSLNNLNRITNTDTNLYRTIYNLGSAYYSISGFPSRTANWIWTESPSNIVPTTVQSPTPPSIPISFMYVYNNPGEEETITIAAVINNNRANCYVNGSLSIYPQVVKDYSFSANQVKLRKGINLFLINCYNTAGLLFCAMNSSNNILFESNANDNNWKYAKGLTNSSYLTYNPAIYGTITYNGARPTITHSIQYTSIGTELKVGDKMMQNQYLSSPNGNYFMVLQENGIAAIFPGKSPDNKTGDAIWSTSSDGDNTNANSAWTSDGYLTMKGDGNLVLYTSNGPIYLWDSQTSFVNKNGDIEENYDIPFYAALTEDGELGIYQSNMIPSGNGNLWLSNKGSSSLTSSTGTRNDVCRFKINKNCNVVANSNINSYTQSNLGTWFNNSNPKYGGAPATTKSACGTQRMVWNSNFTGENCDVDMLYLSSSNEINGAYGAVYLNSYTPTIAPSSSGKPSFAPAPSSSGKPSFAPVAPPSGSGKSSFTPAPSSSGKSSFAPVAPPSGSGKPSFTPAPSSSGKPSFTPVAPPSGSGKPSFAPVAPPSGSGKPSFAPAPSTSSTPTPSGNKHIIPGPSNSKHSTCIPTPNQQNITVHFSQENENII